MILFKAMGVHVDDNEFDLDESSVALSQPALSVEDSGHRLTAALWNGNKWNEKWFKVKCCIFITNLRIYPK